MIGKPSRSSSQPPVRAIQPHVLQRTSWWPRGLPVARWQSHGPQDTVTFGYRSL